MYRIIIITLIIIMINFQGLWVINLLPKRPDLISINMKKRTCHLMNFAIPTDHKIKMKKMKK